MQNATVINNVIPAIKLPERLYGAIAAFPEASYGDLYVAAHYCGLPQPPFRFRGEWQHGWMGLERNIHPEWVVGSDGLSHQRRDNWEFFVARQDQASYLLSQGYKKVNAIGLPIIYVDPPVVERIAGSLLVMPAHSLPDSQEAFDEDEYINYIKSIADKFSLVYLCVHQSCADKGNWIQAFEREGIKVVVGADPNDSNSLLRMAYLFSQFEFVTTNHIGSQIAYASFFGCKVSVAGHGIIYDRKSLAGLVFYKNAPEVLDIVLEYQQDDRYEKLYTQFYVDPWLAGENREWAAWQLGLQCKKQPAELKKLFGWGLINRVRYRIVKTLKACIKPAYYQIRQIIGYGKALGFWRGLVAAQKIQNGKQQLTGVTNIPYMAGRSISLRNHSSDMDVFEQHFLKREILGIGFPIKSPAIILDLGANVGISVAVFRMLFPDARIIALELDKDNAGICRMNHKNDELVEVINAAIWSSSGSIGLKDVGEGSWAFQVDPDMTDESIMVPAYTYAALLQSRQIGIVDIMKMDIEGAEASVLEASGESIFANTKVAIIEVHDWMEGVQARVEKVLEECKTKLDLQVSYNGEFWIITNTALIGR